MKIEVKRDKKGIKLGKIIEFYKGQEVHYIPFEGCDLSQYENGVVKRVEKDHCFVVYNCGGRWHDYENYTAARTEKKQLGNGWIYRKHNLQANNI